MARTVAHRATTRETRETLATLSQGMPGTTGVPENGAFRLVDGSEDPAITNPARVAQITGSDLPGAVKMSTGFWTVPCTGCGERLTSVRPPTCNQCLYCANGCATAEEYFARLTNADQRRAWLNPTVTVTLGGAA